jgi:hypothetical protein
MDKLLDIFLTEQLALRLEREISNQMDELIGNKVKPISRKFSIASKDKKSPFRNGQLLLYLWLLDMDNTQLVYQLL